VLLVVSVGQHPASFVAFFAALSVFFVPLP
jgi:hypothetical protein